MTFRSKIFSGYLLLSLLFSAGILLCLQPLNPIERSFARLAAENLPILNLIQSIRIHGNLLHAEMLDISHLLALDPTPEIRRAIQFEILESDQIRKQLLNDVQEYRHLIERYFPEENLYIPLLQTQIDQLVLINKELKNRAAGQSSLLPLAERSQIKNLERRFLEVTDQIIREEIRETRMRRERINEAVAKARIWIGGTLILFMASALLLAFLMARRLSRPVTRLAEAAEEFIENRTVTSVAIERRDEIGRLAKAVNRMMVQIEKQHPAPGEDAVHASIPPEAPDQCTPPRKE